MRILAIAILLLFAALLVYRIAEQRRLKPINCCRDAMSRPLACDYDENGEPIQNYDEYYDGTCHRGSSRSHQ